MPAERIRYVEDPRFPGMRIPVSATTEKETDRLSSHDVFFATPYTPEPEKEDWADSLPYFIKRGYNESIQGAVHQIAKGKKKFDLSGYEPGAVEDLAAGFISFFMPEDLIALGAGALMGGGVASIGTSFAARQAVKKLVLNGVKKEVAERAVKMASVKTTARVMAGATSSGIQLGSYEGLKSGLQQKAERGDIDLTEVSKAMASGAIVGASMGGVGAALKAKGVPLPLAVPAEVGTLGTVGPLTVGELPTPKDYVDAAGMVLGIKTVGGVTKRTAKAINYIAGKYKTEKKLSPEEATIEARKRAKEQETVRKKKEVWYSRFGEKRQVKVGSSYESKRGVVKIPLYDAVTGVAIPAVTEANFYKLYTRRKGQIKETSGLIKTVNFEKKSEGHKRLSQNLDSMIETEALLPAHKQVLMEVLRYTDSKSMDKLVSESSGRLKKVPGRYVSVWKKVGDSREYQPTIRMKKGHGTEVKTRIQENPTSLHGFVDAGRTFLHEFGHYAYYTLLNPKQRQAMDKLYNSMNRQQRRDYFKAAGLPEHAYKYYAKNKAEFFAQAFAEYTIAERVPAAAYAPLYKQTLSKLSEYVRGVHERKGLYERGKGEKYDPITGLMSGVFDKVLGKEKPTGQRAKTNLRESRIKYVQSTALGDKGLKMSRESYESLKRTVTESKESIKLKDMTDGQLVKMVDRVRLERDVIKITKDLLHSGANIPEVAKNASSHESVLAPLRPAGKRLERVPEGREFSKLIEDAELTKKRAEGEFYDMLKSAGLFRLFEGKKKGRKRGEQISADIENPKVKTVFNKVLDKMYYEWALDMKKMGADVQPYRTDYLPRVWKEKISQIVFDDMYTATQKIKALNSAVAGDLKLTKAERGMLNNQIKKYSEKYFSDDTKGMLELLRRGRPSVTGGRMDYFEAFELLKQNAYREKYSTFGNLEKPRKSLKAPEHFYERDARIILARYSTKLASRYAYVKHFGPKGEKGNALIRNIEAKDAKLGSLAGNVFNQYTGLIELDPAFNYGSTARNFWSNAMSFQVATKIGFGFATIPNITQTLISTAQEAGYWRTLKSAVAVSMPTKAGQARRDMIRRSGSTVYSVLQQLFGYEHPTLMGKVADKMTFISGFKGINKVNNMVAASVTMDLVPQLHKIANQAKPGVKIKILGKEFSRRDWARKKLKDFGVDWKVEKVSEDMLLRSMVKFSKNTQLQKNVLKDPEMFNMPRARPLFTFKRFAYRQFVYQKDVMKREMERGNLMMPLRLAAAGLAGGEFVHWSRNMIKELWSGEPVYRENETMFKRMRDNLAAVGSFGVVTDIAAAESLASTMGFTLTPVIISDAYRVLDILIDLERDLGNDYGISNSLHRSVIRVAPLFGGQARELAKQIQPGSQKENRIKNMRGRVRTKALDFIIDALRPGISEKEKRQKIDFAKSRIKQWNAEWASRGYELSPIDIGMTEVHKRMKLKREREK